jgi:hypothetical protein
MRCAGQVLALQSKGKHMRTLLIAALIIALPSLGMAQQITEARFSDPTDRYDHAILGDALEWGALELRVSDGTLFRLTLPKDRVFEDLAPRLVTLPNGQTLVAVIETQTDLGARLSLYDQTGLVAATPHIGRTHRWLAPIGAADFDGDGELEFAYVDRPHLAKTIRIWRLSGTSLNPAGDLPGFTNHRIGENTIAGGIRDCGTGPEMIVADANWRSVQAITWDGSGFSTRELGPHEGRASFAKALNCR